MRTAVVAVTLVALAGGAGAHPLDTYPEQYEIVGRPGQSPAMDLVAGTTYGMIVSHDGGATWLWVCELGFGVTDSWAPEYELTASGAITATSGTGLFTTRDGCVWTPAAGSAGTDVASTTAVGGDGRLWLGSGSGQAYVQWSMDDGASWTRAAGFGADVLWVESIAVAPSSPQRVYVTGSTSSPERVPRMWRSDEGGQSWSSLDVAPLAATASSELQVAAIAPGDPDRLYVRVTSSSGGMGAQEALFHTTDGGATWSEVLRLPELIPGVVIRADGSVLVAARYSGFYRAPDGATPLVQDGGRRYTASCLAELAGGQLWLCADNFQDDDMGLGRSTDGATWTHVMTMLELAGPIDCAAGTIQRDQCERSTWCYYQDVYELESDAVSCAAPDAGSVLGDEPTCLGCGASPGGALPWLAALLLLALPRRRRQ